MMMALAIITPLAGAAYLIWQIHKRDLRSWQHYACLSSLVFLISILFLVGSNKVQSFDVAGNNIKLVDQKLEEIKALTEQNKLMAMGTVELINKATTGLIAAESYNDTAIYQSTVNLLMAAGLSDSEINKFLGGAKQNGARTNSP
jgi:hypothetical protein